MQSLRILSVVPATLWLGARGTAGSRAATTALAEPGAPKTLPEPAISRRTCARSDTLTVFAEIYDNSSTPWAGRETLLTGH